MDITEKNDNTFREIIEELKLLSEQYNIDIATPYCFPDEDIQYLEDSNKAYNFLYSNAVMNNHSFPFRV